MPKGWDFGVPRGSLLYDIQSFWNPLKIPYFIVTNLGPFCLGEKSPEDTNHLTQSHSRTEQNRILLDINYTISF